MEFTMEIPIHGKRHRTDGPDVEWADGTKVWYLYGEFHFRDDLARAVPVISKIDAS
jgi:hypothetical protein